MQLKQIALVSALVSSVALATVGTVLAADPTPTATPSLSRVTERLSDVQARVGRRISRRIDVLNHLIARVHSNAHLTASDQSLLLKEDQGAVASLTGLKTKVDADTTTADVRTDEKQVASFHVYAFIVPQNHRLIVVSNLQFVATKIGGALATFQTKLDALKAQGNDVSAMQALLNDANSKLQTINGQLATDESALAGLTPTSPNPGATFSQVRKDLGSVRLELLDIRKDLVQLRADAQALKNSTSPAATATP
jgi:hypothetical protein